MTTTAADAPGRKAPAREARLLEGLRRSLGFSNISAVYIWAAVIILFGTWIPERFLTVATLQSVLNNNAVTGLVALSLVIPLAAGVFDLSVGYTLGSVSVFIAYLFGNTDLPTWLIVTLGLLLAIGIGVINAVIVVVAKIDSFIATLATGSLLQALIFVISENQTLVKDVGPRLSSFATTGILGVTAPVFVTAGIAAALWYLLGHTAVGRYVYATGLGREAARLAGIRTERIRFSSLVISAFIAGIAGIAVTSIVSAGSPTVGPSYLIPAFAAAFLGATQLRGGLFNAVGAVIAVLLLGTATTGLALAGVPLWTPYVFTGVVLIAALALGGIQRRSPRTAAESAPAANDSDTPDP